MANDRIATAARMAGEWWAIRLDEQHADKREAFGAAIARMVEEELRVTRIVVLSCDYDPSEGIMLGAVREVVDPACRGCMYSARGILPEKHMLVVTPGRLEPKAGYGNWTGWIEVPE